MKLIKLLISLIIVFSAAFIGQLFTIPSIATWYASLNKPVFNPPNWIFGPVWTMLYLLMAIAAWLVWNKGWSREIKIALGFFIAQLVLNSLWSIIFFGLHQPLWAFVEIVILWLAIFFTIKAFFKLSRLAGWMMIPYILWVSFAGVLNFSVYLLNR